MITSTDFIPAAIKPAIKPGRDQLSVDKAWRVDDRTQLIERYQEACRLLDPSCLMIQEVIPGEPSNATIQDGINLSNKWIVMQGAPKGLCSLGCSLIID